MLRGERVELNLDGPAAGDDAPSVAPSPFAFVGDVLERMPATAVPPAVPTLKSKTGFPGHAKRSVDSRWKQKKAAAAAAASSSEFVAVEGSSSQPPASSGGHKRPADGSEKSFEESQREQIDQENQQRLAALSPSEIEEARQELLNSLDPALIQRILQRSNIDSGSNEAASFEIGPPTSQLRAPPKTKTTDAKKVSFLDQEEEEDDDDDDDDDAVKRAESSDKSEKPPTAESPSHDSIHFPRPPQPPDLDPNSSTFLDDLHEKYFPSLPSDPSKLEWMRPAGNKRDTYDPSQTALNPGDIRFSFTGELIPPRQASEIPVSAGLHHHGDAPDAAGYTIPELAHLSRSTYAPQRCISFQTLGRILYRLGQGEFGDAGEPGANTVGAEETMGELARGLWGEVETQHVIEHLIAESEGRGVDGGRHVSAKTYATEAVWLWRKGGGRRWKAD